MGFSIGEILLLVVVGIIVVGPKRLPGLMRTAGQWIARLRRMSSDLRSQSGLDDLLRNEGLHEHIDELRSLSRFNVVDTLMAPGAARPVQSIASAVTSAAPATVTIGHLPIEPSREREHPLVGCDAYGAVSDDVAAYLDTPVAEPAAAPAPAVDAHPVEASAQ